MINSTIKYTLASLIFMGTTGAVQAEDDGVDFSMNAGVFSEYRFRGISMTDQDPTLQGGFDVGKNGVYAGAWASGLNESFTGAEVEYDIYGGYVYDVSDTLSWDVGFIRYGYSGGVAGGDLDYWEVNSKLNIQTGDMGWSLQAYWIPSQGSVGNQDNLYLNATGEYTISDTDIALFGNIGLEDGAFGDNKLDWSLGASYSISDNISLTAAYIDTDQNTPESKAGLVVSLGMSFQQTDTF